MSAMYSMPTRILSGKGCIISHSTLLSELGRHALIVTGRNSARTNGALADVTAALEKEHMRWTLFDRIEANPSTETVREAAAFGREAGADMVIGIGGGSPMDAAKGHLRPPDPYPGGRDPVRGNLPESGPAHRLCSDNRRDGQRSDTLCHSDGSCHAIETEHGWSGALSEDFLSGCLLPAGPAVGCHPQYRSRRPLPCRRGVPFPARNRPLRSPLPNPGSGRWATFCGNCPNTGIRERRLPGFPFRSGEQALVGSMFSGITIAQTGTTVLHAMGYCLTYYRNIDHGQANALLMPAYFEWLEKKDAHSHGVFVRKSRICIGGSVFPVSPSFVSSYRSIAGTRKFRHSHPFRFKRKVWRTHPCR